MTRSHVARLTRAGKELRRAGYSSFLEALRVAHYHPYTAWFEDPLPPTVAGLPLGDLFELLHHGHPQRLALKSELAGLLSVLEESGLMCKGDDLLTPGPWLITGYRNLLAVADRPRNSASVSRVYIGEDSLRFVDWIIAREPGDRALDIGSGSGISSAALATLSRSTLAVDVDPSCHAASQVTAALNGLAAKIDVTQADVRELSPGRTFDLVVANPPDVPVPGDVLYSVAGNGGEDGLGIISAIIERAPAWLSSRGMLLMYFHSIGDENGPQAERMIRAVGRNSDWNSILVCHSRLPIEVRSAISARWASPLESSRTSTDLLSTFDRHASRLSATHFYGCVLLARAGSEGHYAKLSYYDHWTSKDARLVLEGKMPMADSIHRVTAAYMRRIRTLPDSLRELAVEKFILTPIMNLETVCGHLEAGLSVREATERAFAVEFAEDPINARTLFVLTERLAESLVDVGLGRVA